MPLKDKSLYPVNWKEIRKDILQRENNCCKNCGVKNHSIGYRDKDGKFYTVQSLGGNWFIQPNGSASLIGTGYGYDIAKRVFKIVLTIAHLNHDIGDNSNENLAALCQKCHLAHDAEQHKENAKKTRNNKKGLQELF